MSGESPHCASGSWLWLSGNANATMSIHRSSRSEGPSLAGLPSLPCKIFSTPKFSTAVLGAILGNCGCAIVIVAKHSMLIANVVILHFIVFFFLFVFRMMGWLITKPMD